MRNIFKKVKSQKSKVKSQDKNGFGLSTRYFRLSTSCGYTLLFAMIVASVVLAIGVSILTVSRKEFVLSSSATHSSNSFYAADSGIGCAEYWDNSGSEFATDTAPSAITCSYADANTTPQITHAVTMTSSLGTYPNELAGSDTYTFIFDTPFSTDGTSNKSCAAVTVDKYYVSDPVLGAYIRTAITSRGYNIGWDNKVKNCLSPSPKKVERAIQVTY